MIVLDEWAANQDPSFRWIFYSEILPDLKRQGKTLIAISHDDRYFSAADRYIRLEDGRIVKNVARAHAGHAHSGERVARRAPRGRVQYSRPIAPPS